MIKTFPIELHNIRRAALMVGMAGPAFLLQRIRLTSMITRQCLAIIIDILVAVETTSWLAVRAEGVVAVAAFLFGFRVAFRQRPRHDELFDKALRHGDAAGRDKSESYENRKEKTPSHQTSRPASISVNGPDMHQARGNHQEEKRQMQDMPQRKQSFVEPQLHGFENRAEVGANLRFALRAASPPFRP